MIFRTQSFDPAWPVSIQSRSAVLWVGPTWRRYFAALGDPTTQLQGLLSQPWAAVLVDAPDVGASQLRETGVEAHGLVIRLFEEDPTVEHLPPNRLPVYFLRGAKRTAGPGSTSDPRGTLNRLKMLERIPAGTDVFVVGVSGRDDLTGVEEARSVAQGLRRLIVVSKELEALETIDSESLDTVHWPADASDFRELLNAAGRLSRDDSANTILLRTPRGNRVINLSPAIDFSYPITDRFEMIPARELLEERNPSTEDVEKFLANPAGSWAPYALGIPWPRQRPYESALLRELEAFRKEGPAASFTAWIPAEDGSGATTTLRQLSFHCAREGYPVLLARHGVDRFDYSQLNVFFAQAVGRIGDEGIGTAEIPWIIAFDAAHTQLHWDFVSGLCNGLKKVLRSVVVLAIRPTLLRTHDTRQRALGTNRELGPALENSITTTSAIELGSHLGRFLPAQLTRSAAEWTSFTESSIQTTVDGKRSLFWVALRFWVFRLAGAGESMRAWLARKLVAFVGQRPAAVPGLLEVAALSRHRLTAPYRLLPEQSVQDLLVLAQDEQNPLGFRRLHGSESIAFAFVHPVIAEEVLRIAASEAALMGSLDKFECLNLADLELHIFSRILRRPAAASSGCVEIIEELVTTALRVDPREAPANYAMRDRIVEILESAPDSLFDASQVFNHHLAKARRHLALAPPDSRWSLDACIEQLQLAENHVLDALHNIHPSDESRYEAPLNLWVTLALTLDARSRLESRADRPSEAAAYEERAAQAFLAAQRLDADNSYVLENYARFILRRARLLDASAERTRLVIEAIALLEWEQIIDETARRAEPILSELAAAYELLEEGAGRQLLLDLAASGSEAGLVALALLAIRPMDDEPVTEAVLREADELLTQVPVAAATWRSMSARYRLVCRLRPHAFEERLDLLRQLNTCMEFAWPQQLRLEYGILLFQLGEHKEGKEVFKHLRDEFRDRSGWLVVPRELKFLADPAAGFQQPLRTSVVVKNVSNVGRNFFAIPRGWGTVDVVIRPFLFGRDCIRVGQELDCLIQFTNFGPQAVPPTAG